MTSDADFDMNESNNDRKRKWSEEQPIEFQFTDEEGDENCGVPDCNLFKKFDLLPNFESPFNNFIGNWTIEQKEFILSPPGFTINLATAGSGKTGCLVARMMYFHDILKQDLRTFFISTFTKKAAKKLRQDIKQELLKRYKADDVVELMRDFYCGTTHSLSRRALIEYKHFDKSDMHKIHLDEMQHHFLNWLQTETVEETSYVDTFRKRIKHIFYDEVQDVNQVQYEIILSLSQHAESVSVIGDKPQNIYSFRGSSVRYLNSFYKTFGNTGNFNSHKLTINFRSNSGIVRLCDASISLNLRHDDEHFKMKSYQELPEYEGKRELHKPFLVQQKNAFVGVKWVCGEIQRLYSAKMCALRDICILCRSNFLLHNIVSQLRQMGIKCRFDAGDQEHYSRDEVDDEIDQKKFLSDRVECMSIHNSKGLQWKIVFVIGYDDTYFPDMRELDIRKERNLHYVAMSRAQTRLYLINSNENPSRFITEVPRSLYEEIYPNDAVWAQARTNDTIDIEREGQPISPLLLPTHVGVVNLLRSLQGDTYIQIKKEGLLDDSLYCQLNCISKQEEREILHFESVDDLEQPFSYKNWITEDGIEAEFGQFLDCLSRRMIWQITKTEPDSPWKDKSAERCFNEDGDKTKYVPFNRRDQVQKEYAKCQKIETSWKQLLYPLWVVSWCASFVKGQNTIAYIPVTEINLRYYMPLFERMWKRFQSLCPTQESIQTSFTIHMPLPKETTLELAEALNKHVDRQVILPECTLVGELDFISADTILDFKNFLVGTESISIPHFLQLLLYSCLAGHLGKQIRYLMVYNIIGDSFYRVDIDSWHKHTQLVKTLLAAHYKSYCTNLLS